MGKEKTMELANKAVALIKEFGEISELVNCDYIYESIEIKNEGNLIIVTTIYDDVDEYSLKEISDALRSELRGWGPAPAGFYEAISEMKNCAEHECRGKSKEEIVQYYGNIGYTEFRAEEIFESLKEIETEAKEIFK